MTSKALTPSEGMKFLKERGIKCSDEDDVSRFLQTESLIRLFGYAKVFKEADFDELKKIYYLDSEFRNILMSIIERVEVQLRNFIVSVLATKTDDSLGHRNPDNFKNKDKHSRWRNALDKKVENSDEELIIYYKQKQSFPNIPTWIAVEILSFDMLSMCYNNLNVISKMKVARKFSINHDTLSNWLDAISYVRNKCAHQSQLLGRMLPGPIKFTEDLPDQYKNSQNITTVVYVLEKLIKNIPLNKDFLESWRKRLSTFDFTSIQYLK